MIRSLLYPLGFLANLLFGLRFLQQWIQSEKKKESRVSHTFWRLSFLANTMMCLHGLIQFQYPVSLFQALNGVIAWRNLNLMSKHPYRFKTTLLFMGVATFVVTLLFFLQGNYEWMRPPTLPWSGRRATHASMEWHLIGFIGMLLFASRFWIQWWLAERDRKSYLSKPFWWASLIGALFSLIYFIRLSDSVNILGYSLGIVPYIRNLMLLKKKAPPFPKNKKLFLFAGEQSGDVLGGNLVRALQQKAPHLQLYGVGGPEMGTAGMKISYPMDRFHVMGFSDVLKSLPRLYGDFQKIKNDILKEAPQAVLFIDYPEFNMRMAKALRKAGFQGKLIHYVCPSVWAWRKKRVKDLAKNLDHLLAILPFEQKCFTETPLPVTYVGHPLVAAIDSYRYDPKITFQRPLIAIFPGSRRHEIALNLPTQYATAKKMGREYTLAVSVARPDLKEMIRTHVDEETLLIPSENRYELMRQTDLALATSGTIILELGLHRVPTVATYKIAPFNYLLGRYIFRIHLPFYTLVNIICEREVYPEFIHKDLSIDAIVEAMENMLKNPEPCHTECARLREILQSHDASLIAANTIEREMRG